MRSVDYSTRSATQTTWLVGAVGLLVVLLVGGGWLVVRGLSAPGGATPVAAAEPPAAATGPSAFGAPEITDGVPWGYPLDVDGALAAATTAVAVTGQPDVVFDPDRFADVAEVVFADEEAAAQRREVDAARAELELSPWGQQPASRRMYHLAPLAVRPVEFDPAVPSATVEVWAMTLIGVGDAGGAVFTTSTVRLTGAPRAATWQVASLDSVQGPTPLLDGSASPPGQTRALLRDAVATVPLPVGQP